MFYFEVWLSVILKKTTEVDHKLLQCTNQMWNIKEEVCFCDWFSHSLHAHFATAHPFWTETTLLYHILFFSIIYITHFIVITIAPNIKIIIISFHNNSLKLCRQRNNLDFLTLHYYISYWLKTLNIFWIWERHHQSITSI